MLTSLQDGRGGQTAPGRDSNPVSVQHHCPEHRSQVCHSLSDNVAADNKHKSSRHNTVMSWSEHVCDAVILLSLKWHSTETSDGAGWIMKVKY